MAGSKRLKKEPKIGGPGRAGTVQKDTGQAESCDNLESIDEAATSALQRPSSSRLGRHSRKDSSQDPASSSQLLICSQDLQSGRTIEYKSGLDTFVFPTPSPRLPTSSQRSSPSLASRSATFQLLPPGLGRVTPSRIGMAIGSPSHAPLNWARSQTPDCVSHVKQNPALPVAPPASETPKKANKTAKKQQPQGKKGSSWKLFSNIFRASAKSTPATPVPCYEMYLEEPPDSSTPPHVEAEPLTAMPPLSANLRPQAPALHRQLHSRNPSDPRPRCESRGSVRSSFSRMVRSPYKATHSPRSPWRTTFCQGERSQPDASALHAQPATISRTPRLELDLPSPELEDCSFMFSSLLSQASSNDSRPSLFERRRSRLPIAPNTSSNPLEATISRTPRLRLDLPSPEMDSYSVMFSSLLSRVSSNDSRPSLLERRRSRLPVASNTTSSLLEVRSQVSLKSQNSQNSQLSQLARSLSIKTEDDRRVTVVHSVVHRPRPVTRSQTAPIYAVSQKSASSPESHNLSASYSEASLPTTPTTLATCTDTGSINRKLEVKEAWDMLTSQPMVPDTPDGTNSRQDHSLDLERQMVQVSVARQVSINRARSRIRRTVSTKQPRRVDLITAGNRKSEVGILDSVEFLGDAEHDEMPGPGLTKEVS